MFSADQGRNRKLEALDELTLHELARLEYGGDGALLVLSNPGFRKTNQSFDSLSGSRGVLQIAGMGVDAHDCVVDLASQLSALERAITRMGVRLVEEELPDEAAIDGGLCTIGDERVLYVTPNAPPWRRAEVLLGALRRLPNEDVWLPPEIRELVERGYCGDRGDPLLGSDEANR